MHSDQAEYERQYLSQLNKSLEDGLFSEKYSIVREQVELHRDQQRSWATLRFQVSSMPDCSFARAGLVWGGRPTDEDPDWRAQLFNVHMWELLDARGWGLPPHGEPERVTWLHPYGRAPWEPAPEDEPERRSWERQFLTRMSQLLRDTVLDPVLLDGLELRDRAGQTKALIKVRIRERPGCTFANDYPVWVGWPTPLTAERRAEEFHARVVRWVAALPTTCVEEGLTWGGKAPRWYQGSNPR